MKQRLDPKSVWLFFISFVLQWFTIVLIFGFPTAIILSDLYGKTGASPVGFLGWLWLIIPAFLALAFIWAKLSYHFYLYEITDDSFRKEQGVIRKKYVTIPYDRIQNVDIYRGIIARILGLSDLHIQTAGASSQYAGYGAWASSAEGRLPGLSREVAEQLRDEIIRRAKSSKNQGL